MKTSKFDVIVVGGGPAGAVSAFKCSNLGLNVLLIEQGSRNRYKPCGGILTPACVDAIKENLNRELPSSILCSPEKLGLFYIPPSGREKGGSVRNYRLFNVNRSLFDRWLLELAEDSGVEVWNETRFLKLKKTETVEVWVRKNGYSLELKSRYLIGADGVYSKVRSCLYPETNLKTVTVMQEHCRAKGELDDYFYMILNGEFSPTYSYVIPKDSLYVLGMGFHKKDRALIAARFHRFVEWLRRELDFKMQLSERREIWAIPYGFALNGDGDVILVGDAAGFCNALTGEGIRLAVESGVAAGRAVKDALSNGVPLSLAYTMHAAWINDFVRVMHEFATSLTNDKSREDFVKSELARVPF